MLNSPVVTDKNTNQEPLQHPCTQEEFNAAYNFRRKRSTTLPQTLKRHYSKCSTLSVFLSLFPIFKWIPQYNFKRDILSDLASGFTVAVLHIPQGMAYASLGEVNPIVGLYMAIFPVLMYFLMGTSRHISLGTFSIVCLMAAKPVAMYSTMNETTDTVLKIDSRPSYSSLQVASVVSLTVGLSQVLLGICRVGSLSKFMSKSLVSGFTTGAAVLVFISQLQHVFGVQLKRYVGIFNAIYTISDLVHDISNTNYLALIITMCVVLFLVLYTDFIQPYLKCKCSLPMEMIIMTIGTLISYCFSLSDKYSVHIVGSIPTGLPTPNIPPVELIPNILVISAVIAIVSFSVHISMATMIAIRDTYKIDANQELVASGFGNMVGGFFSCLPVGVSLSRSMVQYTSGGKTQLASVFSCIFLLSVLLYLGKFLEDLPYSVLAGIVIKSLKSMLMQVKDLPGIWKHSTSDGIIWLLTFLSVVLLDIEIGLGIAFILSLLSIILMNQKPYVCLLGQIPNTDIYLEIERYNAAKTISDFAIVQIHAGLHFANVHVAINKTKLLVNSVITAEGRSNGFTLVLDMSPVTFVDPAALQALGLLISDLKRQDITVCLALCSGLVYEQMNKNNFFKTFSVTELFPSIQDAVAHTLSQRNQVSSDTK